LAAEIVATAEDEDLVGPELHVNEYHFIVFPKCTSFALVWHLWLKAANTLSPNGNQVAFYITVICRINKKLKEGGSKF
jgi:hypothetical protein